MLMTVEELRKYITTDESDEVVEAKLRAIEYAIRSYTNNNFCVRAFRAVASALPDNELHLESPVPFAVDDTLQITESDFMQDCLVTVVAAYGNTIVVKEELFEEADVVITKVVYPHDVKMGVVNLMKWELNNRDKVGIASESISRHSVTYVDQTGTNTVNGFPVALMGFLKPYKRARFGRGISV